MRASVCVSAVLLMVLCLASSLPTSTLNDDWHYPPEEPAQAASLSSPSVKAITSNTSASVLFPSASSPVTVHPGSDVNGWHVLAVLPADDTVVFEYQFDRWGTIVFESTPESCSPSFDLRKSVGKLEGLVQPWFNFSSALYTNVSAALEDVVAADAASSTPYGQVDFLSIAQRLTPQRDIADLGQGSHVVKFVLDQNGVVKCAVRNNSDDLMAGGITALMDGTLPAPNPQTIVFRASDHVPAGSWPRRFNATKVGPVGNGFLNAWTVGSWTPAAAVGGYDMVAFEVAVKDATQPKATPCMFSDPIQDTYLVGYPPGGRVAYSTLGQAEAGCTDLLGCGGVTLSHGAYELRAGSTPTKSPYGETSWVVTNAAACHPEPTIPGVDYDVGVYVRFRYQNTSSWNANDRIEYFLVTNTSTTSVPGTEFYTALADLHAEASTTWNGVGDISIPGSAGSRLSDTVRATLSVSSNNFIQNHPNYGNGGTYWSVGREDNGSLPLTILSVSDALMSFGMYDKVADLALYYAKNFVNSDGTINYYTWGSTGDSVGDTGRLVDMYLRLFQLGKVVRSHRTDAVEAELVPTVVSFGLLMLDQISKQSKVPPPAGAKGMLQGPPEHDWSSVTDLYFYSNNVWVAKGCNDLGAYLSTSSNSTYRGLSKELLAAGSTLAADVTASFDMTKVKGQDGTTVFAPPYAIVGSTPFTSMTESREASYSNFRFFPEALLASDYIPSDVAKAWVDYHYHHGGSLGGASRWSTHLDNMPVAGWGWGALVTNQTDDFLVILYGHMATYLSRGTFHSTEQLSYLGGTSGKYGALYRDYLHWPDDILPAAAVPEGLDRVSISPEQLVGNYYSPEQDISYCGVSAVLGARLAAWGVVMEEGGSVWLGRGAPTTWYDSGWTVSDMPVSTGVVSYSVNNVASSPSLAVTLTVQVANQPSNVQSQPPFVFRVPSNGSTPTVKSSSSSCAVASTDSNGFVQFSINPSSACVLTITA